LKAQIKRIAKLNYWVIEYGSVMAKLSKKEHTCVGWFLSEYGVQIKNISITIALSTVLLFST